MKILKYLKLVGIILGIGICQLKSFPYNVITMTRDIVINDENSEDEEESAYSYARLSEEEIYLVFAELANCFVQLKEILEIIPEKFKSNFISKLKKTNFVKIKDNKIPTIIVFNEAFFGQDQPLTKEEVDQIIEIYKKFIHFLPNAYLYINFLYKNVQGKEYESQIQTSISRYKEIVEKEAVFKIKQIENPSFLFDYRIEDKLNKYAESFDADYKNKIDAYLKEEREYLENHKNDPKKNQEFLFNQTKIFYNGEEIGYYNKSSFCRELGLINITKQNMYYIISDFSTIYRQTLPPIPVFCLTCYDIDVIANECYREKMPKDKICIFASNTSGSLLSVINVFEEKSLPRFFIWADPRGKCVDPNDENLNEVYLSNVLECENGKFIESKAITQRGKVLFDFPIASIPTYPEAKNSFKLSVFELTE